MSLYYDAARGRWVVQWSAEGKRRSRRFVDEAEARTFAESVGAGGRRSLSEPGGRGDGVYAYETGDGVRFRFSFRQSDGTLSTRRGYTSRRAAVKARRRLVEAIERGEIKAARETFGEFWARYLEERRPYLSAGTFIDYESHGRKRSLPIFGTTPLVRVDEAAVRRWMRALTADTEAAGLSRKTVNNARTILTVALKGRELGSAPFGENLTTEALDVSGALVGERWCIGSTVLEVVQPRLPCFKLGLRMGDPSFVRRFARASRPGAYLRIVEEGELGAGDAVEVDLASIPDHGVTVRLIADAILLDHRLIPQVLQAPQLLPQLRAWLEDTTA